MVLSNCYLNEFIHLGPDDTWNEYSSKFSKLDVYFSQKYVTLFASLQEGTPEAVYFENENGKIFYPFVKREIDLKPGYFDIITPYGYGGPVLEGDRSVILSFYEQFREYCFNNHIITETVGMHPLNENELYLKDIMTVDYIRRTAAVDLSPSIEEIRSNYSTNNKRNIRKAIKEGVEISVSNNKNDLEVFIDLYYETMGRNNASNFYYFNRSYFLKQMEETELSKSHLLLAKYSNQIIGGIMMIEGTEFAHYHLGASKTEFLPLRANNLLFDAMIEFSKAEGAKMLHLGGGLKDGDSLFSFKSSFANSDFYNYCLGKNIINEPIYQELSAVIENSTPTRSRNLFFPIYREPTINNFKLTK